MERIELLIISLQQEVIFVNLYLEEPEIIKSLELSRHHSFKVLDRDVIDEDKDDNHLKQLIEYLTQVYMTKKKSKSSFTSSGPFMNLSNSQTLCIEGDPTCKMVIDFLNYLVESTPSLELHQMTFTKLPDIKILHCKYFG